MRILQCVVGLTICGIGIALIIAADIGLAPWDVLHKGISRHTGIGVGTVIVIVGFALLLLWIPLGVRPGLGTILNAVLIGVTVNVALPHLPEPEPWLGSSSRCSAASSPSASGRRCTSAPDSARPTRRADDRHRGRGYSLRVVRTAIEIAVLAVGWALGGSIGVGTAVFALAIGPLVHFFLGVFGMRTSRIDFVTVD